MVTRCPDDLSVDLLWAPGRTRCNQERDWLRFVKQIDVGGDGYLPRSVARVALSVS